MLDEVVNRTDRESVDAECRKRTASWVREARAQTGSGPCCSFRAARPSCRPKYVQAVAVYEDRERGRSTAPALRDGVDSAGFCDLYYGSPQGGLQRRRRGRRAVAQPSTPSTRYIYIYIIYLSAGRARAETYQ